MVSADEHGVEVHHNGMAKTPSLNRVRRLGPVWQSDHTVSCKPQPIPSTSRKDILFPLDAYNKDEVCDRQEIPIHDTTVSKNTDTIVQDGATDKAYAQADDVTNCDATNNEVLDQKAIEPEAQDPNPPQSSVDSHNTRKRHSIRPSEIARLTQEKKFVEREHKSSQNQISREHNEITLEDIENDQHEPLTPSSFVTSTKTLRMTANTTLTDLERQKAFHKEHEAWKNKTLTKAWIVQQSSKIPTS